MTSLLLSIHLGLFLASPAPPARVKLLRVIRIPMVSLLLSSTLYGVSACSAQSGNFLTNPVLETFRKLDQLDPDENVENQSNKAILFVPIQRISNDLNNCRDLLCELRSKAISDGGVEQSLLAMKSTLESSEYQDIYFKKIFNRYSDNIFYSNSDQANLYLGGGSLPNSRQTQQYMLRNDILTGVQNTREDIQELIEKGVNAQSLADAIDDIDASISSLEEYIGLCDPQDVELAKKILQSDRGVVIDLEGSRSAVSIE